MAHGDLRLEVWSRPGSNPFQRVDIAPPGPFSGTKRQAGSIGRGQLTVPVTYERLNELIKRTPGDPATDVRRLARVYAEGVTLPVHEFFLDNTGDEAVETDVTLDGAWVEALMADAIVYPWDWNGDLESESQFADWVWGGRELVGPVDVSFAPHIFSVFNTGTSGTLNIGVSVNGSGYEYATVAFDASAFVVEQAIEAMSRVDVAKVTGFGTEEQPWQIELVSPTATYTVAIGGTSLGGAGVARLSVSQFGKLLPIGWSESRVGSTSAPHGIVTDFRASLGGGADPVLPASCEAWVVFLGQEWYFPGVQKIVKVLPGSILQIPPLYLYAQGASVDLRIVVRDLNEQLLPANGVPFSSFEEITVPSNTLTQSVGVQNIIVPDGVTEVVFRVGHIGEGTPPRVFIACPSMREGLAPTTAGAIFDALFDDATLNHVVDDRVAWENNAVPGTTYFDESFTTVVDSVGVVWDNPAVEITIKRGMNYQQVLQALANRGYRWSVTPSNTAGRWWINLYNPTWVKVDATALASPAINVGSGVTSGPIVRSHLTGNAVTIEGDQMRFGRSLSAASIAAIGRREIYQPDRTITTLDAATVRASSEVAARLVAGLSVAVNVDPVGAPVPLVDYDCDWQVNVQIPPALPKSAHRVAAITYNVADTTKYSVSFSSESFTGFSGVVEGTRRLLEKYEGYEREAPDKAPTPILGGGSAPSIVIAASDTTLKTRLKADPEYVCAGAADQGTIQMALVDLASRGGGRILLCEGTYNLSAGVTVATDCTIEGMNRQAVRLVAVAGSGFDMVTVLSAEHDFTLTRVTLDGAGAASRGIVSDQASEGRITIHDVAVHSFDTNGIILNRTAGLTMITDSWVHDNGDNGIWIEGEGVHFISGCEVSNNGVDGFNITGTGCTFIGNKSHNNTGRGLVQGGGLSAGGLLIVGNQFYNNGGAGLDLQTTFGGVHIVSDNRSEANAGHGFELGDTSGGSVISGNVAQGNTLNGFYCSGSASSLTGNVSRQNGQHGIELASIGSTDCKQWVISGNLVHSNSKTTDVTYDGINVNGDSDENFITGNRVYDTAGGNGQRYGINLAGGGGAGGCNDNAVVGNDARGGGRTADYNDACVGTVNTWAGAFGDNL